MSIIKKTLARIAAPCEVNFATRKLTLKTTSAPEEIQQLIAQAGYEVQLLADADIIAPLHV